MPTTPTWLAATSGNPTNAGQVNQFLATHASTFVYPGAVQSQQATAGSGGVNSNGLWIAQSFTTGASQTATGRVFITVGLTGTPAPLLLSLYTNSGSAPGTLVATTAIPRQYVPGTPASLSIPLPASGLTASTTYWLVAPAVGDASDFYTWDKSNQTSGASTSTNGTSWTAQSYGLLYMEYDNSTGNGQLAHIWEDAGARWSLYFYGTTGLPTTVAEYVVAQGTNQYLWQVRNLSYSNGILTGIA